MVAPKYGGDANISTGVSNHIERQSGGLVRSYSTSEQLSGQLIAECLGGRRVGNQWMARCPAHDDRNPSLAISEDVTGKVLVCCHAGCEQTDVLSALRSLGLWGAIGSNPSDIRSLRIVRRKDSRPRATEAERISQALELWEESVSAGCASVSAYLESRGITIPPPDSIRFHSGLRHPAGRCWPCLVSLVTRGHDGKPLGVHRTFLAPDCPAKAPVEPARMMLGPCGGGVVRLAEPADRLLIGEGIETCLSVMQATRLPAWAALSTAGLYGVELPREINDVTILADGDAPGEKAALKVAKRLRREGRKVSIARPPKGWDFNDVLCGRHVVPEGVVT